MQTLEQRIAAAIRSRRSKLGLTQEELARLAQAVGAPWTQSKLAAMETGRRQLGLGEALILGNLLGVGLHELVLGGDESAVSVGGVVITTEQLGRMMKGSPVLSGGATSADAHVEVMTAAFRRRVARLCDSFGVGQVKNVVEQVEAAAHGSAEQKAARELEVSPEEIAVAAIALWERSLSAERRSRRRSPSPAALSELLEIQQLLQASAGRGRGESLAT